MLVLQLPRVLLLQSLQIPSRLRGLLASLQVLPGLLARLPELPGLLAVHPLQKAISRVKELQAEDLLNQQVLLQK